VSQYIEIKRRKPKEIVFSVKGFASIIDTDNIMEDEDKKRLLLKHLRLTEQAPELLGISTHIIAACTKQ